MILVLLTWLGYIFVTLLTGITTAAIIYARWNYGVLEKTKGLQSVVKPYFIGGSDPFFYKGVVCDDDTERVRKYGSAFGYYEGREPIIFISDPELVRLIFIKDFDYFHNKRLLDAGHCLVNEMMDILPYEKWKAVRNYMSPQLTTGKIRAMSFQMMETIDDWILSIKQKANGNTYQFNVKEAFTTLTIDVIARCVFGTKIALDDTNNAFFQHVKKFSFEDSNPGMLLTIVQTFPFLAKLEPFLPKDTTEYFGDLLTAILSGRRKSKMAKINDFVDVMNDMIDECSSNSEYKKLGITETTVMAQALLFLLAGFETTATTMSLMAYRLTQNPHTQDRLIKEVDEFYERHGTMDHEFVGELVYLKACMDETLRMNPALIRIERVCQKEWKHEATGLTIKKGTCVMVPAYAVHYDEKNFPEADKFIPERFLNKEVNPYAYLSFGQGPHNCIGMRFAKEEIQMAIAGILRDFIFEDPVGIKLKIKAGRQFLNNFEPYKLNLVPRKHQ